jgi:EAL domain-containing protein (putative c-di-GMP-specific phosphodiesterase class I)/CHASE2 domain-containing sensor protein
MRPRASESVLRAPRWRDRITVFAATAMAAVFLVTAAADPIEDGLRSLRDALRNGSASGSTVIVEIDARSLERIDRWPLPRSVHARALDQLHRAGARTIAFDIDFSARSTPSEDERLALALARAGGRAILPTFRQSAGSGSAATTENLPIPILRRHSFLGAVNIKPDADGLVRRIPLAVVTRGVPRPSLPAMVTGTAGRSGDDFRIDFAIDPDTIPRYSLVDLIEGRVSPGLLAGRDVLVGATAIETGDRYAVPRFSVVPGVVVQALATETLKRNGIPGDRGPWPALAIAALAIAILVRSRRRAGRIAAAALGATGIAALPLIGEALNGSSFAIVPALAALFSAAFVRGALGFVAALAKSRLEDASTGLGNMASLVLAAGDLEDVRILVARLDRHQSLSAAIGPAEFDKLVLRVAERLGIAAPDGAIFRIEQAALAWFAPPLESREANDHFDALDRMMRSPVHCSGRAIDVTLTFGVASGPSAEARDLAAGALSAAGEAAAAGTRWQVFEADTSVEAEWRLSLVGELDAALADGSIWVAYQPKLDIATGAIKGAEALVRWRHPTRGDIPPDRFIPLIEERGRVADLTARVLDTALGDAQAWSRSGYPIEVAVNVSATLLADPALAPAIAAALASHDYPPERLTVEITESATLSSSDDAISALEDLRSLGIRISIDDYGTGHSTLSYLKRLPAHELKIDRSFVQGMLESEHDTILVRSTIEMAHALGLDVVAEGIESPAVLARLAELGCDVAQGYLIARPMPAGEFAEFLARNPIKSAAAPFVTGMQRAARTQGHG